MGLYHQSLVFLDYFRLVMSKNDNMFFHTGSLVVSACGYDSIPAEFGVIHNTQQWDPPSVPNSVDSYLVLETSGKSIKGNIGTWESAVLGVANQADLQKLRKSRPRRARAQVCISINACTSFHSTFLETRVHIMKILQF